MNVCSLVDLRSDPQIKTTSSPNMQAYVSTGEPMITAVARNAASFAIKTKLGIDVQGGDARAWGDAVLAMALVSESGRATVAATAKSFYRADLSLRGVISAFDFAFGMVARRRG